MRARSSYQPLSYPLLFTCATISQQNCYNSSPKGRICSKPGRFGGRNVPWAPRKGVYLLTTCLSGNFKTLHIRAFRFNCKEGAPTSVKGMPSRKRRLCIPIFLISCFLHHYTHCTSFVVLSCHAPCVGAYELVSVALPCFHLDFIVAMRGALSIVTSCYR